ncbi:hypothetical protein ACFLVN_04700 [Chloroflexota bacterium]
MTRMKTKKKTKIKPRKKSLPWFIWLAIALGIIAVVAFICMFLTNGPVGLNWSREPKAVIIDQLYNLQPNYAFISEATKQLEDYGFEVDLYHGDEVSVDLYRKLPSFGYQLIILRTHSGLLNHETDSGREITRATCIFTNEEYSEIKHIKEQLNGELARARIGPDYPIVFGIGARFVKHSMRSDFNGSVIIVMGCNGITLSDLASAFSDKGVSLYLAWDGLVDLHYLDKAGLELLKNMLTDDTTIGNAVDNTMESIGPDPDYGAILKYFPLAARDKTIRQKIE